MVRIEEETYNELPQDDIYFKFPKKTSNAKSFMVLKVLKNEGSERTIGISRKLAFELYQRKLQYERQKAFYGPKFKDYSLVFCLDDRHPGDPIEESRMQRWFRKWQAANEHLGLPYIVMQECGRHSSITYKVDIAEPKLVAKDSGHATTEMIMKRYDQTTARRRGGLVEKLEKNLYDETYREIEYDLDSQEPLEEYSNYLAKFKDNQRYDGLYAAIESKFEPEPEQAALQDNSEVLKSIIINSLSSEDLISIIKEKDPQLLEKISQALLEK